MKYHLYVFWNEKDNIDYIELPPEDPFNSAKLLLVLIGKEHIQSAFIVSSEGDIYICSYNGDASLKIKGVQNEKNYRLSEN